MITFSTKSSWDWWGEASADKKRRESVCQWVNSLPHLEHIVLDLVELSCAVSLTISAVPMRMEEGIDSAAKGVDSQQPGPWLMRCWTDEITLWVIFVSLPKKTETIAVSCRSRSFSFEGAYLPRSKFNFEVLITFPCSRCPISPANLQGFFSPITRHQGYFCQLDVCLDTKWWLWLTDLCVD